MTKNDVLRSIRYLLNISEAKLIEITALGGCEVSRADMASFLLKEEEPGYQECDDTVLAHFLNGLIYFRRGRDENRPLPPLELPVTNNLVLKKLRVAFELRDTDIIDLITKSGLPASKTEVSAFFRNPGHRNYRDCGDQFLRNFLKGLTP